LISISKLLCNTSSFGDSLRYSRHSLGVTAGTTRTRGPVVVWNCTKTCNLKCIHCYAGSDATRNEGELTTKEAEQFIDDLSEFNVPVLLLSGGEPFIREDIIYLAQYAVSKGIRVTFSTNGTLISERIARKLKEIGVSYVGISLDGIGEVNDKFRGKKGAFDQAVRGIENCLAVGQKVGLRFTINKHNYLDIDDIFTFVKEENIPRVCFYHLVYSGRGSKMINEDITHEETRKVLDLIIRKTAEFHECGLNKEILTVDNHCDGVYLYQKLKKIDSIRADRVYELLKRNGGNRTGIAIGQVDWYGDVHPDQFTQNHTFGNIKEEKFANIWTKSEHPILRGLKDRKPLLKGRCARCQWLNLCNGNFRARAEAVTGNFWESDPACYLTDSEIM